jgi:predicted protein tyrosine phosphatase
MGLVTNYCMPQLQVSSETMVRMKKIVGISHVHDGDYMVNEMINILEKKIRDQN